MARPLRKVSYPTLGKTGRLGNALWEIASTVGLARRHGTDPVFPEAWDYRPYFSLPDGWFGDDAEVDAGKPAPRLAAGLPGPQKHYLQQWSYIAEVINEIRDAFSLSPEGHQFAADSWSERVGDMADVGELTQAISLHVRHGDNLNPETHPIGTWPSVTIDYYRDALDHLDPGREAWVVVFSDDAAWCYSRAGHDPLGPALRGRACMVMPQADVRPPDYFPDQYAAAPATDWVDLHLMSLCRQGHVIANSTYSLWGALLGPAPTTYPNHWVGWLSRPSVPDERTMVPPSWTMIDNPVPREWLEPC